MKNLDYKKDFKDLYLPPRKPVLVNVPLALYAVVDGHGDPNDNPVFQAAIQSLYSISYGIKMSPKKGIQPEGYYQYTVFPLEGLWDMDFDAASPLPPPTTGAPTAQPIEIEDKEVTCVAEATEVMETKAVGSVLPLDKDRFIWRLMIRQPDFVTQEFFHTVKDMSAKKKGAPDLSGVRLETMTDGLSVQIMHVGSYDSEPTSFAYMDEFRASQGLVRMGTNHREIYIGDPLRTTPEKRKTVLRYFVRRA